MSNIKKFISIICLGAMLSMSTLTVYADTEYMRLEDVVSKAVENNQSIKDINTSIPQLNEAVRLAGSGARVSSEMHKKYRVFRFMWNSEDDEFSHLKSLSNSELMKLMTNLTIKLQSTRNPANAERYLEEMEFIEYALIFGNEEPDLTDKELYSKFIRNAELLVLQQENMRDKTLNNLDLIKGNLQSTMTTLYSNADNVKSGIELQNEMLQLRERILSDLKALYNQGLISRIDFEKNELEVEKLKSEIRVLELNYEKLLSAIKNQVGLDQTTDLKLTGHAYNGFVLTDESIATYVAQTKDSNVELESLEIDFDYYTKNKALFDKYVQMDFGPEFDQLTDQLFTLETQILEKESTIEANVKDAYENFIYLNELLETKALSQRNAYNDLEKAKTQYDLGLIKATDVHQVEIAYLAAQNGFKQALLDVASAKIKFGTMIDYGIQY